MKLKLKLRDKASTLSHLILLMAALILTVLSPLDQSLPSSRSPMKDPWPQVMHSSLADKLWQLGMLCMAVPP